MPILFFFNSRRVINVRIATAAGMARSSEYSVSRCPGKWLSEEGEKAVKSESRGVRIGFFFSVVYKQRMYVVTVILSMEAGGTREDGFHMGGGGREFFHHKRYCV